jgi:hypothetical protein
VNPNETNGFSQPLAPTSGDASQDPMMPLGIGGFESNDAGDDVLASSGGGKKTNTGTLLLVAVVIVGLAGLLVMKQLAGGGEKIVSNPDLDRRIRDILNPTPGTETPPEELARKEAALRVIKERYRERQVPLVNVARNPFVIFDDLTAALDPIQVEDPHDLQARRWQREREQKRQLLEEAGETFMLKSVMMGSSPLANISGKIVRFGDTILAARDDIAFVVESITASSVVLKAADEEYDLEVAVTLVIDRN